jgi:AraC-like DNA-binding protein
MPFAPQIRKQVLQALEQHILPALRDTAIRQVRIAPPFDLAPAEHWEIKQKYLPHKTPDPLQVSWKWNKQQMSTSRIPYLIFVYEGIADHKIGITTRMAKEIKATTGKTISGAIMVRLPAPCVAYFPPRTPGHSRADPTPTTHKSLCLSLMSQDVRFHLAASNAEGWEYVSHSLQIHDPLLLQMAQAYGEEIAVAGNADVAQAQLYVMLSRFHRLLLAHRLPLANSAWPTPQIHQPASVDADEWELCRRTMDYIETRLSSPLNRIAIARAMNISADHLGRIFHRITGMTVMRYVTRRRLEAAKLVLAEGPENIAEVATLAGFANAATFCATFKRINGISPKAYRREHQPHALKEKRR